MLRHCRPHVIFVGAFIGLWLGWPAAKGAIGFLALLAAAAGVVAVVEMMARRGA